MHYNINNIIDESFSKYIINEVNNHFPVYRKHKYNYEYCLKMFKFMLNDTVKWKSLSYLSYYMGGNNKYHYKYLNFVFNKWASNDI